MRERRYDPADLRTFCERVLEALGVPEEDARVVADSLTRANLEGTDSHGVSRLPVYARRMGEGRISPRPDVRIEHHGSVLRVDGGNALGQVASHEALKAAMPVARETGLAGAAVRHSNHFGTAAYYCQLACDEGLALIATTNSPPGIAPWGGREAYLGTNPVAFGFPVEDGPPVVVDMSSSVVARGRIINAAREGMPIPEGWATDEEGLPTTDAAAALRGAGLPLGGAKGYALALAVEILSGVLTGAAFGPHVNNLYGSGGPPSDVGHCFILMDVSRWLPEGDYKAAMDQLLREIKESPRARGTGEILYPGERRHRTRLENRERGIALPDAARAELIALAEEHGLSFPNPLAGK